MASRFWVGGTGTWDAADTTHWAASSAGAGGQSVPGSGDTVTFDGSSGGGTVTVNHATNTITSLTMGAFTGTLDFSANNNNITMGTFSGTGSGTRTLNMGNGTWTLTSGSASFDITNTTNLTFNANSSTILYSGTATTTRTINLGAKTFNNITVTNASFNTFLFQMNQAGTIANLTLTNVRYVQIAAGVTLTISGTLTYDAAAATPGFLGTVTGAVGTISVAAATVLSNIFIQNITKAGAGSLAVTNGFDGGNNTNVTIYPAAVRPSYALGM